MPAAHSFYMVARQPLALICKTKTVVCQLKLSRAKDAKRI